MNETKAYTDNQGKRAVINNALNNIFKVLNPDREFGVFNQSMSVNRDQKGNVRVSYRVIHFIPSQD